MTRRWSWLAAGIALLAAFYFVGLVWARTQTGVPSYDLYSYTYPILLYARRRLADGVGGLLWNPFQNCGQPFFGISSTGLLHPTNVFYLMLGPDQALSVVMVFNLTVAGVSTYLLARELGAGRLGAIAGSLAFELGNTSIDANTFGPLVSNAVVWMPAILWAAERLLRAPTRRGSVGLAVLVAVGLLSGFPQAVFFTYQVVALRVLWALAFRQLPRPGAALGALALGLGLGPLLVAVQYVPGLEMARLSVRNAPLTLSEILEGGTIDWKSLRDTVTRRVEILDPLLLLPFMIASWSLLAPGTRRRALFYLAAGLVFFALAFGRGPVFEWYLHLPFSRTFRGPGRFLWVTGICLAVLTALGIEALRGTPADTRSWQRGLAFGAAAALALLGFRALSRSGLWPLEWVLGGVTVAAGIFGASRPSRAGSGAMIATAALVLNLTSFPLAILPPAIAQQTIRPAPFRRLLPSSELLLAQRELFAQLRARMTAQDRVYQVYPHANFSLMAKSAMLFEVPAIQDYEPQPTRRSAEYAVMMRTRAPLRTLDNYYRLPEMQLMITGMQRGLLDLAAARYLVVDASVDATRVMQPPVQRVFAASDDAVRVYENPSALPRARYVPRVEVVHNPDALLRRLDRQRGDATSRALVERPPASGFIGEEDGDAGGEVEFLVDEPERVVLRVSAPRRGFLHLADQYFPGWRAAVNGVPSEILVANFLFRLVEVPAGESIVEFRYVPTSLRVGAAVSGVAIIAAALLWWMPGRRWARSA